jgi:hypothetical protein
MHRSAARFGCLCVALSNQVWLMSATCNVHYGCNLLQLSNFANVVC